MTDQDIFERFKQREGIFRWHERLHVQRKYSAHHHDNVTPLLSWKSSGRKVLVMVMPCIIDVIVMVCWVKASQSLQCVQVAFYQLHLFWAGTSHEAPTDFCDLLPKVLWVIHLRYSKKGS